MKPSTITHPTLLAVIQNVLIIGLVGALGYFTLNPLVLFALTLLPTVPIVQGNGEVSEVGARGEEAVPSEYGHDSTMGFTASIKGGSNGK